MEFQKGDRVVCINRKQSNILVVGKIYTVKYSKFDGGVLHFEEDERGFNGLLFIPLSEYRKLKIKKLKEKINVS